MPYTATAAIESTIQGTPASYHRSCLHLHLARFLARRCARRLEAEVRAQAGSRADQFVITRSVARRGFGWGPEAGEHQ